MIQRRSSQLWQNSWTAWKNKSDAGVISTEISQKAIKKHEQRKNSEDGMTAEILDNGCKELQFDDGLTEAATVLLSKETGAQHVDRFRPIACLTTMRKLVGYVWLMTMEKIKRDSFQTAYVNDSHPLQGALSILMAAEEAREWDIPLFAAQVDLKKSFHHVDRNQGRNKMK